MRNDACLHGLSFITFLSSHLDMDTRTYTLCRPGLIGCREGFGRLGRGWEGFGRGVGREGLGVDGAGSKGEGEKEREREDGPGNYSCF